MLMPQLPKTPKKFVRLLIAVKKCISVSRKSRQEGMAKFVINQKLGVIYGLFGRPPCIEKTMSTCAQLATMSTM